MAPRAGSVLDGGDGRDHVYVTSESGLLDLDLRKGTLVADAEAPYTTPATHFEDASLFARRVVIGGTDSRNDLRFSACDARLRGRGGADTMARSYDSLFESVFCPRFTKAHLNGGSGRDDLEGTLGRDVLLGGKGKEILDGGAGADREGPPAVAAPHPVLRHLDSRAPAEDLARLGAVLWSRSSPRSPAPCVPARRARHV